jgi:hypothetical protein
VEYNGKPFGGVKTGGVGVGVTSKAVRAVAEIDVDGLRPAAGFAVGEGATAIAFGFAEMLLTAAAFTPDFGEGVAVGTTASAFDFAEIEFAGVKAFGEGVGETRTAIGAFRRAALDEETAEQNVAGS